MKLALVSIALRLPLLVATGGVAAGDTTDNQTKETNPEESVEQLELPETVGDDEHSLGEDSELDDGWFEVEPRTPIDTPYESVAKDQEAIIEVSVTKPSFNNNRTGAELSGSYSSIGSPSGTPTQKT